MGAAILGAKRRWAISATIAAMTIMVTVPLFRVPVAPVAGGTVSPKRPEVTLSLRRSDELALRDLEPLYLPTRYNAASSDPPQIEPGRGAFDSDPGVHLVFDEHNPKLALPLPVQPPKSALEAIGDPPGPLASGLGRTNERVPRIPRAGAHVEVFASDNANAGPETTGSAVLNASLPLDASPAVSRSAGRTWQPLELMAVVDVTGLVGPLLVTRSSGVSEIDVHFRNYLGEIFRIGDRLPPGFYRIVVGP